MALDAKKLAGDFGFAIVAQAVGLLVGFANTLLLPRLLPEASYGYWQLFLLYAGYSSIFTFGLVDGIYLILGGKRRDEIDPREVNGQFRCCLWLQVIVGLAIAAVGFLPGLGLERSAIVWGVAFFIFFFNMANYLGYLFQALGETRLYSLSMLIESLAFFLVMIIMIGFGVATFEPYVAAYVVARVVRLGYCIIYARDILNAGTIDSREAVRLSRKSMGIGIKLLISTLSAAFIVGVARFVIDSAWSIETFAVVSLALALVNFFMNFTAQAAMVLFPALRRIDHDELAKLFLSMRDGLSLLLPVIYVLYIPAVAILKLWLPNYAASFELMVILLPLCVFNGKMDVVGMTMLKVMREEGRLLRINVMTCAASTVGALIGGFVVHSIPFILVWIVVCVICRCLYAERFVTHRLGLTSGWVNLGSIVVTLISVFTCSFLEPRVTECIVIAAYIVYLVIFRDETAKLLAMAKGSVRR